MRATNQAEKNLSTLSEGKMKEIGLTDISNAGTTNFSNQHQLTRKTEPLPSSQSFTQLADKVRD